MPEFEIISGRQPIQKQVIVQDGNPAGYEQLTVGATAVQLTIPLGANRAVIIVEDATIRWRDDGTDPTSTVGMNTYRGGAILLGSALSMSQFSVIRTSSTSAKLSISYYVRK